jgi:peptidoglycan/xylan/chitin deacetylase (PgdA/CDA1 family)
MNERRTIAVGTDAVPWAYGQTVSLPVATHQRLVSNGAISDGILHHTTGITSADVEALRLGNAYTTRQPLSARLPISYRWVPGILRSWLATRLGHRQRQRHESWAAFPRWPLDLSTDFLADAVAPTPRLDPTPVVLSHDLDSAEGMTNIVQHFLTLEERYGARSTNFVVPCSWCLDQTQLRTIERRGHELGIHGYDHSNRTAFAAPAERRRRLLAGAELARRYGMKGYRAPSLLRTDALLAELGEWYTYDSSIPTSGGLFPVPNNGCATARPFALHGLTEVPLSLPRDGSLRFLGYSPDECADLWIACAERIAASGGVVVLLTHGEQRFSGNPAMLAAYERFLKHIAHADHFRWATAGEVVTPTIPHPSETVR